MSVSNAKVSDDRNTGKHQSPREHQSAAALLPPRSFFAPRPVRRWGQQLADELIAAPRCADEKWFLDDVANMNGAALLLERERLRIAINLSRPSQWTEMRLRRINAEIGASDAR